MNERIEPRADLRMAAKQVHEMFVALINEGFDEHQALVIIGHILASQNPRTSG